MHKLQKHDPDCIERSNSAWPKTWSAALVRETSRHIQRAFEPSRLLCLGQHLMHLVKTAPDPPINCLADCASKRGDM